MCDSIELLFQSTRPRGARQARVRRAEPLRGFNPRAREGRDAARRVIRFGARRFNPRAREGRDFSLRPCSNAASTCFNPRAREGRDFANILASHVCEVSIHAPARGATTHQPHIAAYQHVSIHAPARGATRFALTSLSSTRCFNPRAREGRD